MTQSSKSPTTPKATSSVSLYNEQDTLKAIVQSVEGSSDLAHEEITARTPEDHVVLPDSGDGFIHYETPRPRPSFLPPQESLSGVLAPQPRFTERLQELESSVAQQERQIEGLLNIAASLRQSTQPESAMQSIVVQISQLLGADRTTIYEVSEDGEMLNGLAVQGEVSIKVAIKSGRGLAGLVAQERRVINLRDAYEHPNFDVRVDRHTGYRTRSVLCVPMFGASGEVIGVVQVLNKLTGTFSKEDQNLLCALAAQAAITLEALRLECALAESNESLMQAQTKLSQKLEEQELLFEIEKRISNTSELSALAESVLARSAEVVRCEHVGLFVVDSEDHGPAYLKSTHSNTLVIKERVLIGEGIMGKVAARGEDFILMDDTFRSEVIPQQLWYQSDIVVKNALAASLFDGTRVLGALVFVNCDVLESPSDVEDEPQLRADSIEAPDWLQSFAVRGGSYSQFDAVNIRAEAEAHQDRLRALRFVSLIARQLARGVSTLLTRQEEEQRSRLMSIGQMLSGVLHDIKGPMTSIRGYTQLLSRSDDSEQRERLAQTVLNKVNTFNEMTSDIIAFARGESQVLWRKVFLSQFVESVLESVKFEYEEHGVQIEVEQDAGGVAYFDEGKMRRVVVNIARNARQALGERGSFRWRLSRSTNDLVFTLSDDGPGIPIEIRDRVFELFSTMGKEEGTGLGLAIVKQIVDDHEGTIELETESGVGTTFTISIPQHERGSSSGEGSS